MHLYVYPKVFFQRLRIYTMSFQILARCNSIFNQLPSSISKLSFEMFLQFTMGFGIQPFSRHTDFLKCRRCARAGAATRFAIFRSKLGVPGPRAHVSLIGYSYNGKMQVPSGRTQTPKEFVDAFVEVGHLSALMMRDAVTGGYPREVQQIDGLKKVGLPYF